MSYHVYFSFSTGFSRTQRVPKGTLESIRQHLASTEETLGLQRTPNYTPEGEAQRPGWHWDQPASAMRAKAGPKTDHTLPQWWMVERERDAQINRMGRAVREHNAFVRGFYDDLIAWRKRRWKRGESERITVAQGFEFWGGLALLDLPKELWDEDHFRAHMDHLHTLLTRRSSDGVKLNCEPLTPRQVSAMIWLLEGELDQWEFDLRFEVPLDAHLQPYDQLATSSDGGYDWCEHCGPIHSDSFHERCRICPRAQQGKCDLKNSHPAEFDNDADAD